MAPWPTAMGQDHSLIRYDQLSSNTYTIPDYFDELHAFAVQLIKDDLAYVCHQELSEVCHTSGCTI